jgi:hypothetical protein
MIKKKGPFISQLQTGNRPAPEFELFSASFLRGIERTIFT